MANHNIISYVLGHLKNTSDWLLETTGPVVVRVINYLLLSLVDFSWSLLKGFISIGSTVICIGALIVLISFIKSLCSRYKFIFQKTPPNLEDLVVNKVNNNKQLRNLAFINRLLLKYYNKTKPINQTCYGSLSNSEIQLVHNQLSWYHTQGDIESVDWINRTFETLWPSIKTLLNQYVLNDILKPKRIKIHSNLSKGLAKRRTKLSIYISAKRELESLRKSKAHQANDHRASNSSIFAIIVYTFKFLIIYIKQFLMDYIAYLLTKRKRSGPVRKNINLKDVQPEAEVLQNQLKCVESWAGFDLGSGQRNSKSIVRKDKQKHSISAPAFPSGTIRTNRINQKIRGLSGLKTRMKFKQQRLKLAKTFDLARRDTNQDFTIEKITFGDSIPSINGIRCVEDRTSEILADSHNHTSACKDSNMKFMSEISYISDKNFQIRVNSLPLLDKVRLSKFSFQIRISLTVNHSSIDSNEDIDTIDEINDPQFPMINYAQLTIVDVPQLDWRFDRPEYDYSRTAGMVLKGNVDKKTTAKQLLTRVSQYLDPILLINHSYFKFIIHSIIFMILRWFRPFDIRIGSRFYIKSMH